ncbi:unnamed protein product [Miscanthus lutarioriparius]|uniref:DYW domain-containing protein n=1 Tax=Miscanthus lutarioriparius TaxID=422564 RepID=A0A811NDE1_9POAL|nr:unnamed protein product [Miscanthus lutarioriparius]
MSTTAVLPSPASTRHTSGGSVQHGALTADRAAALLVGCASVRRASELHAAAVRAGVDQDKAVAFRLQRAYAASGRLDLAVALLRRTPDPTAVFYTSAIHAHSSRGLHHAALALLSEMLLSPHGLLPTAHTLSASLPACSGLAVGRALHGYAVKLALSGEPQAAARALFDGMRPDPHVVSVTAMLACYAKMGLLDDARSLFDGLPSKDLICWNAMMDGYTQHGRPSEALRLFRRMLRSGVEPDEVSVVLALSAVAQLGMAESGRWLHSFVNNSSRRVRLNARVGTALIDMYYKRGSLEDAVAVFRDLGGDVRDIVAWNAMINGYAMHGHSREALAAFGQLRAQGLWPTDITFIGVLNACSHSGLVDEGRELLASMEEEYGIQPKVEHYGCMVDLLGRAGRVEEAFDLVQSMKTTTAKPDTVMWASLLSACRLHKNMALGQQIADYLVANGLANSGTYVLLSNIYAAAGNWREVGRVRSMMRASGIQKEPGCSAVEVGRRVVEFVAGDRSHPRAAEIYAKLEEVKGMARARGHVPRTELVLHDLDDDDAAKEQALAVHSEKLALAFGLISTPPGTAIKIVKNLRACADCHAVLKLASEVTGRRIVFRDRNRFHHFVDGSCTCGDYW